MSLMDELFEEIYGFRPTKEGQSYEMLAAAVVKILNEDGCVKHNQRLRGEFSKSLYQIDVLYEQNGHRVFGEAKDYTNTCNKVGRPDLQKLGGGLPELEVTRGLFFSATEYSREAKKYAAESSQIVGKPIDLAHLRKSTEKDREGRIESIHLTIWAGVPLSEQLQIEKVVFTPEGEDVCNKLRANLKEGEEIPCRICDVLEDRSGVPIYHLGELLAKVTPAPPEKTYASFVVPGGHLRCGDTLIPLRGLTFTMPWLWFGLESFIATHGKPKLF